MSLQDLAKQAAAAGALVVSIRVPSAKPTEADPRGKHFDKFLVQYRTSDFQLKWNSGKPCITLEGAWESCFGPLSTTDLSDLLA